MSNFVTFIAGIFLVVVCVVLTSYLGIMGFGISVIIFILAALVPSPKKCEICGKKTKGGSICGDCLKKIHNI